jgi:hypothetical protein
MWLITSNYFPRKLNKENENINDSTILISFLEAIKEDYQNCGLQFCTALNKFVERYFTAKSISILWLSSFLYSIDHNVDVIHIKSGAMIHVQVEFIKWCKLEGSNSTKQKLSAKISEGKEKENSDPQTISSWKKRKTGKKEHNLSKNISKNWLNWIHFIHVFWKFWDCSLLNKICIFTSIFIFFVYIYILY